MLRCEKCRHEDVSAKKYPCSKCDSVTNDLFEPKKQTNADRIRSMSDEELAEFSEQISTDSMDTISFGTKDYEEIWEHKETALKWLQSEVEVDNFD